VQLIQRLERAKVGPIFPIKAKAVVERHVEVEQEREVAQGLSPSCFKGIL
jgi:hypothetical protein